MKLKPVLAMIAVVFAWYPLAAHAAGAEEAGEMFTDRPDQAESSHTVGAGHIQVEAGGDVEWSDGAEGVVTSLRTPLKLRFGVSERWEIHLQSEVMGLDVVPSSELAGMGRAISGVGDLDAGFKWNALKPGGELPTWIPSAALLLAVSAPFGSVGFGAGSAWGKATLAADFDLPGELGLAANLGLLLPLADLGGVPPGFRFAATFAHPMDPISDHLGAYVELFGEGPFDRDVDPLLSLGGGITYLVARPLQIDLSMRAGVIGDLPVVGAGLGVSYRI